MTQESTCICKDEDMMDNVPGPCAGQRLKIVWSKLDC